MSNSDVLGIDDFDDLIAAVDSLEIPAEDSQNNSLNLELVSEAETDQPFVSDIMFDESANPETVAESGKDPKTANPFLAAAYKTADSQPANSRGSLAAVRSLKIFQDENTSSRPANFLAEEPATVDSSEPPAFEAGISFEQSEESLLMDEFADAQVETFNPYEEFLDEHSDELSNEQLSEGFDGVASANEISYLLQEEEQFIASTQRKKQFTPSHQVESQQLSVEELSVEQSSAEPLFEESVRNEPLFAAAEEPVADPLPAESLFAAVEEPIEQPQFNTAEEPVAEALFAAKEVGEPIAESIADPVNESSSEDTITLSEQDDTPIAAFLADSPKNAETRKLSLYGFSQRFPRMYMAMATVFALAGFAYIAMLPALFGVAMFNGFEMLNTPFTNNIVLLLGVFFSISLFLFMATYKLFDLKFIQPEGITLDEENAAQLIEKIKSLRQEHRMPKIHEVVLTRRHELNVIKVPRFGFGLPIWSKNVLAIGYPLLQTLPEEYFNVALSRRLIQFTKRGNMLVNWLSFMRRTWTLYAASLKDRNGVMDLLHYCFFAPYASMYRSFAVYISQKDELLADDMALSVCNDRDLLKTAQTIRLTQSMLVQYFWPKLNEALQDNLSSPVHIRPYHNLPGTLESLLTNENVQSWFIRLAQETRNEGSPEAPFNLRMEQMGHSKVTVPSSFETSAAQHYFGEQYQEMTDHMDELWAEEVQKVLFMENLEKGETVTTLPFNLTIEPA